MERKTTHEIWDLLESNLKRLENASRVENMVLQQTQAAISMLLECDPAEVLDCIDGSPLPTRATVSWLAFEGGRMGLSDRAGVLVSHWTQQNQGLEQLIPPPLPAVF